MHVLRSQAHEYLTAQHIVDVSNNETVFSSHPLQQEKRDKYAFMAHYLKTAHPTMYSAIVESVKESVAKLPKPGKGYVSFVEQDANSGQVWDVKYVDETGSEVFVSCKLSSMEDKAYRFNTANYALPQIQSLLENIFTLNKVPLKNSNNEILSYEEAIQLHNTTRVAIQREVIAIFDKVLREPQKNAIDYAVFEKLIKERFVGVGNYWKIDHKGNAIFYPPRSNNDDLQIDSESITLNDRNIYFNITLTNLTTNQETRYAVAMRVKMKDNPNKKISANSHGVSNWAATVKLTLL
jgi:hypothetical protein